MLPPSGGPPLAAAPALVSGFAPPASARWGGGATHTAGRVSACGVRVCQNAFLGADGVTDGDAAVLVLDGVRCALPQWSCRLPLAQELRSSGDRWCPLVTAAVAGPGGAGK
eukprot:4348057-Prymnesium_polylepis.1